MFLDAYTVLIYRHLLHIKIKFPIKGFFIKYDQICRFPRIWSYVLKKSLTENLTFCAAIFVNWDEFSTVTFWPSHNVCECQWQFIEMKKISPKKT